MWCIIVWNVWWNWLAISASKYQEIGCSSLSFDYTCKICDGTELEKLQRQRLFIVQNRCQSKEDAVFWQTLKSSRRSPESRPACFTPEKLSVRGWDIIAAFINWTSSFEALKKKLFKSAPLKSIDAKLQQGNALWHYGNVWEGNRVSRPAICSWFWTKSSSKWTCTFLVNKMLTQEYIFEH